MLTIHGSPRWAPERRRLAARDWAWALGYGRRAFAGEPEPGCWSLLQSGRPSLSHEVVRPSTTTHRDPSAVGWRPFDGSSRAPVFVSRRGWAGRASWPHRAPVVSAEHSLRCEDVRRPDEHPLQSCFRSLIVAPVLAGLAIRLEPRPWGRPSRRGAAERSKFERGTSG